MPVFDDPLNVARYERWFRDNPAVFESEVTALGSVLPHGNGFEVGIGTGLFAERLGVMTGNDVSGAMLVHARERGRRVYECDAENLPVGNGRFDFVLMVTTICFLKQPERVLRECHRILKPGGAVIIGFVDKESVLGQRYCTHASESLFYRAAIFYSVADIRTMLAAAGFTVDACRQTVFGELDGIAVPQDSRAGTGEGVFAVVRGKRK